MAESLGQVSLKTGTLLRDCLSQGPRVCKRECAEIAFVPFYCFFFLGCKRVFLQVGSSEPKVELT